MDKRYSVLFYETGKGGCPTEEFLSSLSIKVRAKMAKWIEKLEEHGPDLPRPYADVVSGKIRELRLIFASTQYRLMYFFHKRFIVITHGFVKKQERVPISEIDRAERFMSDFEGRFTDGEHAET